MSIPHDRSKAGPEPILPGEEPIQLTARTIAEAHTALHKQFHPAQQWQATLSARRTTYPVKLGQESGVQRPIGRYDLVPESVKGRPVIGRERPTGASYQ